MKSIEKLLDVLSKNMGYTIVLVLAILMFGIFSDGLIAGTITALSALIGYACVLALYREYKHAATPTKVVKKRTTKKK